MYLHTYPFAWTRNVKHDTIFTIQYLFHSSTLLSSMGFFPFVPHVSLSLSFTNLTLYFIFMFFPVLFMLFKCPLSLPQLPMCIYTVSFSPLTFLWYKNLPPSLSLLFIPFWKESSTCATRSKRGDTFVDSLGLSAAFSIPSLQFTSSSFLSVCSSFLPPLSVHFTFSLTGVCVCVCRYMCVYHTSYTVLPFSILRSFISEKGFYYLSLSHFTHSQFILLTFTLLSTIQASRKETEPK